MHPLSATLKGNNNLFYNIWELFLVDLTGDLVGVLQKGFQLFVFTDSVFFT